MHSSDKSMRDKNSSCQLDAFANASQIQLVLSCRFTAKLDDFGVCEETETSLT